MRWFSKIESAFCVADHDPTSYTFIVSRSVCQKWISIENRASSMSLLILKSRDLVAVVPHTTSIMREVITCSYVLVKTSDSVSVVAYQSRVVVKAAL